MDVPGCYNESMDLKDKNSVIAAFKEVFEANIVTWRGLLSDDRMGNEMSAITPEEIKVFDISMADYPAMVALYEAYEAILDICDMGTYDKELCVAMREAMGFPKTVSVEEFQALGQVLGVSYRNAAAMYHKVAFGYVRAGLTTYRDETT